jgi:hypothetical protein
LDFSSVPRLRRSGSSLWWQVFQRTSTASALSSEGIRGNMASEFSSFRFCAGMEVWIADEKECWVRGVVTKAEGNSLTVRNNVNKAEKVIIVGPNIERELLPSNLPQNSNITDIIKTEYLHEASLLETLKLRHSNATSSSSAGDACEEIYTYAGPVLLSCNPYKRLDIYGPHVMRRYSATVEKVCPPPQPFNFSLSLSSSRLLVHDGTSSRRHAAPKPR